MKCRICEDLGKGKRLHEFACKKHGFTVREEDLEVERDCTAPAYRPQHDWDEARVIELHKQGLTPSQIVKAMGKAAGTDTTAKKILARAGFQPNTAPVKPEGKYDRQIIGLWEAGHGVGQIKKQLGTCSNYVKKVLNRIGVSDEEIEARKLRHARQPEPTSLETREPSGEPAIQATVALSAIEEVLDETHFYLDEEAELPGAVMARTYEWIGAQLQEAEEVLATAEATVRREQLRILELNKAKGLMEVVHQLYQFDQDAAEIVRTLRRVTDQRVDRLKEAS